MYSVVIAVSIPIFNLQLVKKDKPNAQSVDNLFKEGRHYAFFSIFAPGTISRQREGQHKPGGGIPMTHDLPFSPLMYESIYHSKF